MNIKRIMILAVLLLFCVCFVSCSKNDIDAKTLVDGIICDDNSYIFVMTGEEEPSQVNANDLESAIALFSEKTGKNVYLGQDQYIIFEDDADTDKIIKDLKLLSGNYQASPNIRAICADKSARKFIIEEKTQSDFILNLAKDNNCKLYNVIKKYINDGGDVSLPVLRVNDSILSSQQ